MIDLAHLNFNRLKNIYGKNQAVCVHKPMSYEKILFA